MKDQEKISENRHKLARLGGGKTKSIVAVIAVAFFVLYVTSVGVQASTAPSGVAPNAPNAKTKTVTVTSTTTQTLVIQPNIQSGNGNSGIQTSDWGNTIFSNSNAAGGGGTDCQVTVSLATNGFEVSGVSTLLVLAYKNGEGDQFGTIAANSADTTSFTDTISAASVTLAINFVGTPSYGVTIFWSWTAICPSA